jgi:hypothetical protein
MQQLAPTALGIMMLLRERATVAFKEYDVLPINEQLAVILRLILG